MNCLEEYRQRRIYGGTRGRRAFKSATELEAAIEAFFESCDDQAKASQSGSNGELKIKPPTVSGLCSWLGISRQTLTNYRETEKFGHIVVRARSVIEAAMEEQLSDRDGFKGARFNLAVNFGWVERRGVELSGPEGEPIAYAELERFERAITPVPELDEGDE